MSKIPVTIYLDGATFRTLEAIAHRKQTNVRALIKHSLARSLIGPAPEPFAASTPALSTTQDLIRQRVMEGNCDAEIAAELNTAPGWVAAARRQLGLRPNRRFARRDGLCTNGHVIAEDSYVNAQGRTICRACSRLHDRERRQRARSNG